MSNNGCSCSACSSVAPSARERTRFYPRQIVTPDDLNQVASYFLERSRRHNRLMHGWGIVCGAQVCFDDPNDAEPCRVRVKPGYILGPYGDEIVLDKEAVVNICEESIDGDAFASCAGDDDVWCAPVPVRRGEIKRLFLAIRYDECETRPVRVQPAGCGCDGETCEYSRVRDGYVLRLLSTLPSTYSDPMTPPKPADLWKCPPNSDCGWPCPPCPKDPWIILADLILTGAGHIKKIDCAAHRRYVPSFAKYFFVCT